MLLAQKITNLYLYRQEITPSDVLDQSLTSIRDLFYRLNHGVNLAQGNPELHSLA